MNLDKLQVNAKIRSGWQALDLGFLMARAWWRPLVVASLIPALPLFLVLLAVFWKSPLWAVLFIWWLKPFWERLPLFTSSRLLFGENPDAFGQMKSLPLNDSLPWLLWRRFSVQRAFDAPVTVLEELEGTPRRNRLRVLHGRYSDVALANQFVCFCFEALVAFGLMLMVDFFTPENIGIELTDQFDDLTLTGEWLLAWCLFASMVLVMPFHCMAGFALYLNRRIELEAWDIEISFRNMATRLRGVLQPAASTVTALLLGLTLLFTAIPESRAAVSHDRDTAAEMIETVLQGPDFGSERVEQRWRFKNWEEPEEEAFPEWLIDWLEWWEDNMDWAEELEGIAAWLKLLLVVLFVLLLLYLFNRFRAPLGRLLRKPQSETAPEILFGLDVTPESLPQDVPAQVLALWRDQDSRAALGLLYRASLSRLIERYQLGFRASHTESECAELVRQTGNQSLSDYFHRLTRVWRRLAYGHQLPTLETVETLCRDWQRELPDEPA